jgi:hypothetical protein
MTITEETRYRMYQKLEQTIGHDEATVLMEHLPPVGWADVATKRDLDHLALVMRRDIDQLRGELDGLRVQLDHQGTTLRGEIENHATTLRGEIENHVTTLRGEIEALRLSIEASLHREISSLKSSFIWMLLASNATFASIVLAAAKFV